MLELINYKFSYDDIVKVVKVNNLTKAKHLERYIGKTGEIINRIALTKDQKKYKIKIEGETHYFNEDELEKINL